MFSKVDLPHPDGPMIARNSPAWMSSETPLRACVSTSLVRYVFDTLSSFNMRPSSMHKKSLRQLDAIDALETAIVRDDDAFARGEPAQDFDLFGVTPTDFYVTAHSRPTVSVDHECP